ncbi:DMT family transporter [Cohaesibacter celericrescens]|uniref:Guanidinium exporter n=1 Tax=Cohaesibacter celericrescens TaxID=2067669 RepID=A0A2N5XMY7_9HYPH|nr:multidrug efflux SMR transporter [Cohaesibacter celericrescens]PLW75777.1 QacE family quaternary ammonium compound efflux SMR transporter [Cohaesibacter celericrescens]
MAWVYLVLAGILEIIWAYMLKQSDGFSLLVPSAITVVTMIGSFGLLSLSMRTLPLGTAYGIWTGIGAVGTFIVGILFLGELISPARIIAAILIVGGLLLMKFSSDFQM